MTTAPTTVVEALAHQLRACASAADGLARPAAILWTDPDGQWLPMVPALQKELAELLVYGPYDLARRSGPAIWLRCLVDRTLPEPPLPNDRVPILYLPCISRQTLGSGESCPHELQPLVELMFRGVLWLQKGHADWTVTSFLTSSPVGLDLARDAATKSALMNALREVVVAPLVRLKRGRLEARDFDEMLSSDVVRDLLRWMGDPAAERARMGPERWLALRGRWKDQFAFDPESDGPLAAGERMGRADGAWAEVWARFEEAPAACPGIPDLLSKCPQSLFPKSHWPMQNGADEKLLVEALARLNGISSHTDRCDRVLQLEKSHGARRETVWAKLGEAPMALVLRPLAALATAARSPVGGGSPDEIARTYVAGAWRADAAAWQALALVPVEHEEVVRGVVQQLAEPWLDASAREVQRALDQFPGSGRNHDVVEAAEGGCLIFVDGLRYDLGRRLGELLEGCGCTVAVDHRWAAFPTVTATGKPAVTPNSGQLGGARLGENFAATFRGGKEVDAGGLRADIAALGYQILGGEAGDWPLNAQARGFLEFGDIDTLGHQLDDGLPRQLDEELERLRERITRLFDAGWKSVRVVTDHGWLFLPKGLPRVDLPKHLTTTRWSRCAVIAGNPSISVPRIAWHWNSMESVAVAPGIACFNKAPCYAHGGLSIQEALTPDVVVTRGGDARVRAKIRSITWRGMRCLVEAESSGGEVRADLRLDVANGESVVKVPKALDADGSTSLIVKDDQHERAKLVLVLLGPDQTILAQQATNVGVSS